MQGNKSMTSKFSSVGCFVPQPLLSSGVTWSSILTVVYCYAAPPPLLHLRQRMGLFKAVVKIFSIVMPPRTSSCVAFTLRKHLRNALFWGQWHPILQPEPNRQTGVDNVTSVRMWYQCRWLLFFYSISHKDSRKWLRGFVAWRENLVPTWDTSCGFCEKMLE